MLFRISGVISIFYGFAISAAWCVLILQDSGHSIDTWLFFSLLILGGLAGSFFAIKTFPWTKLNNIKSYRNSDTLDESMIVNTDIKFSKPRYLLVFGVIGLIYGFFIVSIGTMSWLDNLNFGSQGIDTGSQTLDSFMILVYFLTPFVVYYDLRILLTTFSRSMS